MIYIKIKRFRTMALHSLKVLLLTVLMTVIMISAFAFSIPVKAEEEPARYTGVIEDLQKDPEFDVSKYPKINTDYSLQVIQIAESSDGELFVYVYQPSGTSKDFRATEINISIENDDESEWSIYTLEYVNNNETLYKYVVKDFIVSSEIIRYYNISSISRLWDRTIDNESGNDNIINTVAYPVGQLWTVLTYNDKTMYSMHIVDVVELKCLYANSIRYITGSSLFHFSTACDVFFVAFSTDRKIDELQEADVSFMMYPYRLDLDANYNPTLMLPLVYKDQVSTEIAKLNGEDSTEYEGYKWKWIESANEFLEKEADNISNTVKDIVKSQQWVLRYAASEVKLTPYGPVSRPTGYTCYGNTTEEVSILRLKFVTNGETYNLGVVSGKVTGTIVPTTPDPEKSLFDKFLDWVKNIMSNIFGISVDLIPDWAAVLFIVAVVIVMLMLLMVLIPFFPVIGNGIVIGVKAIGHLILYLFKGLWWLISSPFRLIKNLIDRGKGE